MEKRFQESNWLVKLIRYRHYVYIPFKWIWFSYFKQMVSYEHYTNDPYPIKSIGIIGLIKSIIRGKRIQCHVWKILIGMAQSDMNWYYTSDEVFRKIKRKWDIQD